MERYQQVGETQRYSAYVPSKDSTEGQFQQAPKESLVFRGISVSELR